MLLSRRLALVMPGTLMLLQSCWIDYKHPTRLRFATFNIAMGLDQPGELQQRLESGDDEGLRKLASIIQQIRPDVLLLNEFDYMPDSDSSALLLKNYFAKSQPDLAPITFSYSFDAPVNTGIDSGLDLDKNGSLKVIGCGCSGRL